MWDRHRPGGVSRGRSMYKTLYIFLYGLNGILYHLHFFIHPYTGFNTISYHLTYFIHFYIGFNCILYILLLLWIYTYICIYVCVCVCIYCQEWEIDQLLQFCRRNFILLILLVFLRQNIGPKYAPPRRGKYKVNWRGSFAAPPFYIIGPSRRGIFWLSILL